MTSLFASVLFALGALQVLWHYENPVIAAVATLPAAAGLAVLRPRQDRMLLAALFTLFYFVHGATEWAVGSAGGYAMIEVALCVFLYVLLIVAGRRFGRGA